MNSLITENTTLHDPFPIPYDRVISGGNVRSILEAKIVFVQEEHGNRNHINFFVDVIQKFGNKFNDLILVEDSCDLSTLEIKKRLALHTPEKSKALSQFQIKGWDHPKRTDWLNDLKKNIEKIESAVFSILHINMENSIGTIKSFALLTAYHNRFHPENKIDHTLIVPLIMNQKFHLIDPNILHKLYKAGKKAVKFMKINLVSSTFEYRQTSLRNRIFYFVKEVHGRLFVNVGAYHIDVENNPFMDEVLVLIRYLEENNTFIVLNPAKANSLT